MVQEFRNFGMSIVNISETKWFGQSVYDVDGFLILHSGHPVPGSDERFICAVNGSQRRAKHASLRG